MKIEKMLTDQNTKINELIIIIKKNNNKSNNNNNEK